MSFNYKIGDFNTHILKDHHIFRVLCCLAAINHFALLSIWNSVNATSLIFMSQAVAYE